MKKLTSEEFIIRAINIHNNKYDYSKTIFDGMFSKVIIICPIHGEYQQIAHNHLIGHGCSSCKADKIGDIKRSNGEEFKQKAIAIYGNNNDYSKIVYIDSQTKVCVTCLIDGHGDFWVTPNNHLKGRGCPACKSSKGELAIKSILDKHNIKYIQEYIIPNQKYRFYYDFYLPELNILIEFHGIQHYKYIPHFHRNEEDYFLARRIVDDIKITMANVLKYKFLVFNYKELEKLTNEQFENLVLNKIKY